MRKRLKKKFDRGKARHYHLRGDGKTVTNSFKAFCHSPEVQDARKAFDLLIRLDGGNEHERTIG